MAAKTTLEDINGQRWYYRRARLCDGLEVLLRTYAWHLWDDRHEYHGNFRMKADMIHYIHERVRP